MKKGIKYLLTVLLCFGLMVPIYAKDVCTSVWGKGNSVEIDEKIPNTVHIIILVIQIAVPVILVVIGMIDFIKAMIAQKEDEMKKAQMLFVKRLISAVLVFFVFVIVKLIINFVADDKNVMGCANCFINGPDSHNCAK